MPEPVRIVPRSARRVIGRWEELWGLIEGADT